MDRGGRHLSGKEEMRLPLMNVEFQFCKMKNLENEYI